MTEQINIRHLLKVYEGINTLARLGDLPDDLMDTLVTTLGEIRRAIIEAPVRSDHDLADKFRLAASMIEDECGYFNDEPGAVEAAYGVWWNQAGGDGADPYREPSRVDFVYHAEAA